MPVTAHPHTSIGHVWTCTPGALYRTQPKADFCALIGATFFRLKWTGIIIFCSISDNNIKLKYREIFRIMLHFTDNWVIFSWCSSVPVCICIYICAYIYSARRIGLFQFLNQLFEYSKSHKHMAHIIYWKGRNYYSVITQC